MLMMQQEYREFYMALLRPPGTIQAAIQRYQNEIFSRGAGISALALSVGIPLRAYSSLIDPPGELRLAALLETRGLKEYEGSLYLDFLDPGPIDAITAALPPALAGKSNSPIPCFPGYFISLVSHRGARIAYPPPPRLKSASFTLALFHYRLSSPDDDWWEEVVETLLWEKRVRKPRPLAKELKKG